MTFDENAKLLTGGDIPAAVALLEGAWRRWNRL